MEERLRLIGGEFLIVSQPGSGTRIEARLTNKALEDLQLNQPKKVTREQGYESRSKIEAVPYPPGR